MTKFDSTEAIPELVPEVLWIPQDRADLLPPHAVVHTRETTTPREVGHILFTVGGWLSPYQRCLEIYAEDGKNAADFLRTDWMNHTGRAVARAALDPDRLAPINMLEVFKAEEGSARFPDTNQRVFFDYFVDNFGVLRTR